MVDGAIALSGGRELADKLEAKVYHWVGLGVTNPPA